MLKRALEFHGWKRWSHEIKDQCGERAIAANSYQLASKLSFYLDREVPALNIGSRKNQFDIWPYPLNPSEKVCYVTDKKQFIGVPVLAPDGKKLKLVMNLTLSELLPLKTK